MRAVGLIVLLGSLLFLSSSVQSQRRWSRSEGMPDQEGRRTEFDRSRNRTKTPPGKSEFTFARLKYPSYGWGEGWTTDYPKADEQFIVGLRNWCRSTLIINDDPSAVGLDDKELYQYPFIYAVEPGRMELSSEDAAKLREYLTRGGFLLLDDFWGEYEWQNVQQQMHKVFPESQIRELPLDHPIFHCYFDINEVVQVPNFHNVAYRGRTDEKGGVVPYFMGITDDQDRVLVFIARNMDNGDAWEWIEQPEYPLKYGLAAYRLGMNLIVYAMTH